jgi:Mg-chelatase subunit ChlD
MTKTTDIFSSPRRQESSAAPQVAIITFKDKAQVWAEPDAPVRIPRFTLNPDGSTNEAAGLCLAGEMAKRHGAGACLNVILFGDGEPTAGGGLFGSDVKAAVDEANELKSQGARIATIGFEGPTIDFSHLREIASSPALALRARAGTVTSAFVNASQSLTQNRRQTGPELIVFVIDCSGSMDEGSKKQEVEEAVRASLEYLCTL